MVALNRFFQKISLDLIGFSTSALCAIHCLIFPVFIIFGSVGSMGIAHNHQIENAILAVSAVLGISSLLPSYRNHHRSRKPLAIFTAGVMIIVISRFPVSLLAETILTTAGAILVAFSHALNWRFCRLFCSTESLKHDSPGTSGDN